jgi:hypothetical protein
MKFKFVFLLALSLVASSFAIGQQARRWAIVTAHGPAASSNGEIARAEARLTDDLTTQLTGLSGVALIDRASIDKVLKEQNFQNSDRSSADTAARIGKLLGVGQMVMVQVYDASYTTHAEQSGNTTRTTGTVVLRANARMIDAETAVIQAQPSSAFQESVPVSETSNSQGGQYGPIRVPARKKVTGGDPKVIEDNEWAKASETVAKDLAGKLTSALPTISAVPTAKTVSAMVAGIVNGEVFINRGATVGIKAGDKFQVTRVVDLKINDPETGKPMTKKQPVCVLTIVSAEESNASGKCQGGLPQSKDVAEPLR